MRNQNKPYDLTKPYRVTVGYFRLVDGKWQLGLTKDNDFATPEEAQTFFEEVQHSASLWKLIPLTRGVLKYAWQGIKNKRVRNGKVNYFNY